MRTSSAIFVLGCSISAFGQTATPTAARNGFAWVVIQNRIEPSPSPAAVKTIQPGIWVAGDFWFHRYFTDSTQKKYFGYDMQIDQTGTDALRITFRPLSEGLDRLNLPDAKSWSSIPLPSYPVPQLVNNGDIVVLDLMVNPSTGQKIVDYLLVRCVAGSAARSPRDFNASDAELRIVGPSLSVNGTSVETVSRGRGDSTTVFRDYALGAGGIGDFGGASGGDAWFYLSGHGRFVFSLTPRNGYRKVGEVRLNTLSFVIAGNKYVLSCRENIAPGPDTYSVYVLHDPAYRPKGSDRDITFLQGAGL